MSVLSSLLHFLAGYRFFLLPAFILGTLGLTARLGRGGQRTGWKALATVLGMGFGVANVLWGPEVNGGFLSRNGIEATATVTGSRDTGSEFNDQRIFRHAVVYRTRDGQTGASSFDDDDFNVYPAPHGGVSYPMEGESFTIRFIPGAPANFVIITNDASPYGRRVSCSEPIERLDQARREWEFERKNARFTASYAERISAVLRQGCAASPEAQRELEKTLAELRSASAR